MTLEIVWNAAGLSHEMTGIERLAVSYVRHVRALAPEVHQVVIVERRYEWLDEIADIAELLYVPHVPATILFPRFVRRRTQAAWHTWANPVWPRLRMGDRLSFTVHDWTPFEPGGMKARHRLFWQGAMLANLAMAHTVHFTTAVSLDATPRALQPIIRKRQVLVGGDVPTLPAASESEEPVDPYVLAVGTHIPRKRLSETADLWSSRELAGTPRLVIAGRGTEGIPTRDRVEARGYVSDAELSQLIADASAVICLSDREGLNLPAREALRAGCPVIGTGEALGTLVGAAGVAMIADLSWARPDDLAAKVRFAYAQCVAARGLPIGSDVGDGDALSSYLIEEAKRLGGGFDS